MAAAENMPPPRKASKQVRRQQLIEATIDTLARKGYSAMTLADVARTAGLSGGIVNFHFESKEKLLVETLRHLADDYRRNWREAVAKAGPGPVDKLASMMASEFSPAVCTPRKLAAWLAFWAEAQSRPIYLENCGANDAERTRALTELVAAVISDGGYGHDPADVALALDAQTDGLWLYLMTSATPLAVADATRNVFTTLAAFFPAHFTAHGLRRVAP